MSNSLLHIENRTSKPMQINRAQVRVRSQVVQLRLPFAHGGLIWNRPVAVVIQTAEGQDLILPVHDVTRRIILALTMLCASTFLLSLFKRKSA